MFKTLVGMDSLSETETDAALAAYRYEIFVKGLGWKLPDAKNGIERDQFDRPDTLYVVASDENGAICGCARLLPTTKPYLLADVFPELLCGALAPRSSDVWELSRFATKSIKSDEQVTRGEARRRFHGLLARVARVAIENGAQRLITFTALGIERILRGMGLHVHRAGPPSMIDDEPILAMWIELDCQTLIALDVEDCRSHFGASH
ncbi:MULTISPECIES: acyl-homoserine-lactone synthase [unclassified Dyella]|uniref:acyl-homoserine-lactone synthase n=1 Tax=unclassified Dyella TaxID=2634549 RepID=UPI000C85B1D5|nr:MULTISPECIES: acyl-homoserine-lactone synthase [unclassified Dyella]MDR3443924.1 acyl-homoserine-lactone synthase [Dyella sp.]PMQ05198.1 Acyl-homoserine-lactone synthase [Dyella sp. AD56]